MGRRADPVAKAIILIRKNLEKANPLITEALTELEKLEAAITKEREEAEEEGD